MKVAENKDTNVPPPVAQSDKTNVIEQNKEVLKPTSKPVEEKNNQKSNNI